MLLTITNTKPPATDLGYLLHKNPSRVQSFDLSFGKAHVFYPEATSARCTAALLLDIDPVGLVRTRRGPAGEGGLLQQYVNDRPYVASSFMSVAIARVFASALGGNSKGRPQLVDERLPLSARIAVLPCRGGEEFLRSVFEPLGYGVSAVHHPLDEKFSEWGEGPYYTVELSHEITLQNLLAHLYVLIPVLDADKHYWVGDDEVEKLLDKGQPWLAGHPQKELIARRYLKNRRALARAALARLAPEESEEEGGEPTRRDAAEEALEAPVRLNDLRLDAVAAALAAAGAASIADLGCGEGKLLQRLVRDRRFTRLIGLDASARSLEYAARRLKLDLAGGPSVERVKLLHGALTYRDDRWKDVDAAALVEVVEHLDADRLPALIEVVFAAARPKVVIVTTPNADHNVLFPGLPAGTFRHPDHRFEWSRAEFQAWVAAIEVRHGYRAAISGIGEAHAVHGAPTQMAVFTR